MSTSKLLSVKERELVAATSPKRLAKLDVDQLVDLHQRVRRARSKYLTLYRRQAGDQVGKDRARGVAATKNQRTSVKAEVFEEALGAVSAQLAVASKQHAAEIRKERSAAERKAAGAKKSGAKTGSGSKKKKRGAKKASAKR